MSVIFSLFLFHILKVACVGLVTCTIFLRTRLHPTDETNGNLYLSCLFFGLIHMMFNGFSELPITISRLPVFYKQRDNFFYPAWAWSISSWILRVPYSIIEAVVWSCVVYYTVGFAPGAGRHVFPLNVLLVGSPNTANFSHRYFFIVSGFSGLCYCSLQCTKWHWVSFV